MRMFRGASEQPARRPAEAGFSCPINSLTARAGPFQAPGPYTVGLRATFEWFSPI